MTKNLRSQGIMVILSSPSGAGKSSLSKALVMQDRNTYMSVSATTRPIRPGEIDGTDYHFLLSDQFDKLEEENAFLERANVFGNRYGTILKEVDERLSKGIDVIFDIDWQGAETLRAKRPDKVVSIYILPPSINTLRDRLTTRRQDDEATIERRMKEALQEISHYGEYDYIVINDNFADALLNIQSIINAERSRRLRLDKLDNWVKNLF